MRTSFLASARRLLRLHLSESRRTSDAAFLRHDGAASINPHPTGAASRFSSPQRRRFEAPIWTMIATTSTATSTMTTTVTTTATPRTMESRLGRWSYASEDGVTSSEDRMTPLEDGMTPLEDGMTPLDDENGAYNNQILSCSDGFGRGA